MNCTTTQGFGENANPFYKGDGLKGHTGIDIVCGSYSSIQPKMRFYVYKVLNGTTQIASDGSGFTGVFGIDEENNEWLYGHCIPIAEEGRWYETWETIGYESNKGRVYSGGIEITKSMQDAGDTRGHHRHIQKRECEKVSELTKIPLYKYGGEPLQIDGKYIQIIDYNNGFNGCVDWSKDAERKILKQIVVAATKVVELLRLLRLN